MYDDAGRLAASVVSADPAAVIDAAMHHRVQFTFYKGSLSIPVAVPGLPGADEISFLAAWINATPGGDFALGRYMAARGIVRTA